MRIFTTTAFGLLLLALTAITPAKAKIRSTGKSKPALVIGSKSLGAFLGAGVNYDDYYDFGYIGYAGYSRSFTPSIGVIYDQGVWGNVGPGTIGVGGVIAYKHSTISYLGDKDYSSSFVIGVRGTYHLTLLSGKVPRLDPYGGATLGLRFTHYTTNYDNTNERQTSPIAGLFVGASYSIAAKINASAELGYDVSIFRAGVSLRL